MSGVISSTNGRPMDGAMGASAPRAQSVQMPGYDPETCGIGIVHIGIGAFHRAHQAVYTDDALAAAGGNWRIHGISLRSSALADQLNRQQGRYTVLAADTHGVQARLIGSIARVTAAARDHEQAMHALTHADTKIVTLTVTEKAYGIDRQSGRVQPQHPAIAHDLAHPAQAQGVLGLLVAALLQRRDTGIPPFTVLCCDNLPDNGALVHGGLVDHARRLDPSLAEWIQAHVACPASMVDRITPAPTEATITLAESLTGRRDEAAVETEAFSMWVIEDRFPQGRPAWELAGALMVDEVAPYEHMKLRMLNGTHSLLAYAGYLAGAVHVRDAMQDPSLLKLARRHLQAAAATLPPLAALNFNDYAEQLLARFSNPAIAHQLYQIAMDGSEKLPQRLLAPAVQAMSAGQDIRPYAFAVAAWMRYCLGHTDEGTPYALQDPRAAELSACVATACAGSGPLPDARLLVRALHRLPGLFPDALTRSPQWCASVEDCLNAMLTQGMRATVAREARRPGSRA